MHTYSAATTPPPWSSKVQWSGRWDQQHDGVVLMVESICGQGFAYAREVEEDRQKTNQTRATDKRNIAAVADQNQRPQTVPAFLPFISARTQLAVRVKIFGKLAVTRTQQSHAGRLSSI
jgi:hypothetical protein